MRVIAQRVTEARVTVAGQVVGEVSAGWLALVGVAPADTLAEADKLADRLAGLRAFRDDAGKMNLAVRDIPGAGVLAVSNFTLYADCTKGRRPGFSGAAPPAVAEPIYEAFVTALRARGILTTTGQFGAAMQVQLINDGPVTFVLEA